MSKPVTQIRNAEQEHEPDDVGQALRAEADPRPEDALQDDHQRPATVERRERQAVHERQVGRQDARDVERQDRTGVEEDVADLRSRSRPARRPAGPPSGC